jgi:hypothetical protein
MCSVKKNYPLEEIYSFLFSGLAYLLLNETPDHVDRQGANDGQILFSRELSKRKLSL